MTPRTVPLAALALLALATASPADTVTTTDGLALEGKAVQEPGGGWRLETADGELRLSAARVVRVTPGEGPRSRFLRKAAEAKTDDVAAQFRLALEAEAAGLPDLARAAYERVVVAQPDHAAARRALSHEKVDGTWMPADEARRRRGLVLFEGAWRLPGEVDAGAAVAAVPPSRKAGDETARVAGWVRATGDPSPVVVRAAEASLASVPGDVLLDVGRSLLYDQGPEVRKTAARFLARLGDESALKALLLSGARDADAGVRREAVLAAASFGNDDTTIPFVRLLGSENPRLVAHGAEAIALLGDQRAAAAIVKRLTSHGSSGRNYVAFLNQVSYVRDYDVEIAQASNIANPNVATLQEGVILDAHVLDATYTTTWVEQVLMDSLSRLAGQPIRSPDEARAWYAEHAATLPTFPQKPSARAPRRAGGRVIGVVEPR